MKNGGRAYTLPPVSIIKFSAATLSPLTTIAASANNNKPLIYNK